MPQRTSAPTLNKVALFVANAMQTLTIDEQWKLAETLASNLGGALVPAYQGCDEISPFRQGADDFAQAGEKPTYGIDVWSKDTGVGQHGHPWWLDRIQVYGEKGGAALRDHILRLLQTNPMPGTLLYEHDQLFQQWKEAQGIGGQTKPVETMPARDGIEAQHGLNDTYPGDPVPVPEGAAILRELKVRPGDVVERVTYPYSTPGISTQPVGTRYIATTSSPYCDGTLHLVASPAGKGWTNMGDKGLFKVIERAPYLTTNEAKPKAYPKPTWPNGSHKTIPAALRYLADHDRPEGGEQHFNSAHLFQLAGEAEATYKNTMALQARITELEELVGIAKRYVDPKLTPWHAKSDAYFERNSA